MSEIYDELEFDVAGEGPDAAPGNDLAWSGNVAVA
jgi:hypothetical protein